MKTLGNICGILRQVKNKDDAGPGFTETLLDILLGRKADVKEYLFEVQQTQAARQY